MFASHQGSGQDDQHRARLPGAAAPTEGRQGDDHLRRRQGLDRSLAKHRWRRGRGQAREQAREPRRDYYDQHQAFVQVAKLTASLELLNSFFLDFSFF